MAAAGRGSAGADRSRSSDPQPLANGLRSGDAGPSDAPVSPPQSAFAAEEVQQPAAEALAAKQAASAGAASAADASAARSTAAAPSSAPRVSNPIAALPAPSLASRLNAGTGVLASSQVLDVMWSFPSLSSLESSSDQTMFAWAHPDTPGRRHS